MSEKKKRGERPIYFICCAIKDNKLVTMEVQVPSKLDRQMAVDAFKKDYDIEPEFVSNAVYHVKGTAAAERRISVSVNADNFDLTDLLIKGVFQNWNLVGHGIKALEVDGQKFEDNELFLVSFTGPVDPENKQPKPRLGDGAPNLRREVISNLVKV